MVRNEGHRIPASTTGALPTDILDDILRHLPAQDVCRFSSASTTWSRLCSDNLLWKHLVFRRGWKKWNIPPAGQDVPWKNVYKERMLKENIVGKLLETIMTERKGRIRNMQKLAEAGLDAVDVLEKNLGRGWNDYLTRTYYARRLLRLINRRWVISQWFHLMPSHQQHFSLLPSQLPFSDQATFPLEYGAFLISKFNKSQLEWSDIEHQLDALAEEATLYVIDAQSDAAKTTTGSLIERRAKELYQFLFHVKGFKGAFDSYYMVKNSLIDHILRRRLGIPITLTLMYHAIGRRLGIMIDMIGFPQHFLARVVTEDGTPMYIDCMQALHHDSSERWYMTREECVALLREMRLRSHLPLGEQFALEPCKDTDIYMRMAANIIAAVHKTNVEHHETEVGTPAYGALMLLRFFSPSIGDSHSGMFYTVLHTDFPEDIWFAEGHLRLLELAPMDPGERAARIAALRGGIEAVMREDDASLTVRRRGEVIRFRVGQVMVHERYFYTGVIYGWDPTCAADEIWMQRMGVDRLLHGRHQPFYNVLSFSPTPTHRYVAQENIRAGDMLSVADRDSAVAGLEECEEIGQWFERWDAEGGVFVPNAEMRGVYIDDWEA